MQRDYDRFATPLGEVLAVVDEAGRLLRLEFADEHADLEEDLRSDPDARRNRSSLFEVRDQVRAFLSGERVKFDLRLAAPGTDFQNQVWRVVRRIPFGKTLTYRALAERVGRPQAVRAVGRANATNPLSLVVPCHRVVGSDGGLHGYGGGLARKAALLEFEAGGGVSRIQTLFRRAKAAR